jgi:hypothetical protein
MIKLYGNMYISADPLQFILIEKRKYEKGKNIGQEYEFTVGYFPSLTLLFEKLFSYEIKKEIASEDIKTLEELKKRCMELSSRLKIISEKVGSLPNIIKKATSDTVEVLK